MNELTSENIAYIKQEYLKLDSEIRRKIMLVAQQLSNNDEQTLHSAVWYFSQKKNRKELDSLFKEVMNEGLDYSQVTEGDEKSSIPQKIKIVKKKK